MKTISQAVSEYIKSKPFLSSALSDGIINFTSLSRKIKPEIEEMLRKSVNNGAIVMALNRLSLNLEFQHTQKIKRVIKKIEEVSVRSNLVDYNFKVSDTILNSQSNILKNIYESKNDFYTSSRGIDECNIVVSKNLCELVENELVNEFCINKTEQLLSLIHI